MMSRNGLDRVLKKFRLGPGTVQVRFKGEDSHVFQI